MDANDFGTPQAIRNARRTVEDQRDAWRAPDAHAGTFHALHQAEVLLADLEDARGNR